MSPYIPLTVTIPAEVVATTTLKSSNGFSKLLPSVIVVIGYAVSFYFLSVALKTLPTNISYAIWAGAGIVLISIAGWVFHKQALDMPALIGIGLIISGVLVINLMSKSRLIDISRSVWNVRFGSKSDACVQLEAHIVSQTYRPPLF